MYSYKIEAGPVLKIWDNPDKSGEPVIIADKHPMGFAWPNAGVALEWLKENYILAEEPVTIESTEEGTTLLEDAE